jgi:gluconokinase
MPASLLASQIEILEEPGPNEDPLTVDIGRRAAEVAEEIIRRLGVTSTSCPIDTRSAE